MSTEYPFQPSQSLFTQHTFTAHLFWARHPAWLSGNTLREGAQERGKAPPQPPGVVREAHEGCREHEREWRMVILWRDSRNQSAAPQTVWTEAEVWTWTHREQPRNAPSKFSCQMLSGNVLGYSSPKLQIQLSHLPCSADSHKPHEKCIT